MKHITYIARPIRYEMKVPQLVQSTEDSKRESDHNLDLSLSNEVYFDGMCELRVGCDDVRVNLILLNKDMIEAFIIDWADYSDFHTFEQVMDYLHIANVKLPWKRKYKMYPTQHGLLVTTHERWILRNLHSEIRESVDKYQVSTISPSKLEEILAPSALLDYLPSHTLTKSGQNSIRGDRFIVYIRDVTNDHSSIILRKFNDNFSKYIPKLVKLIKAAINGTSDVTFDVTIFDIKTQKDIKGERRIIDYDPGEVLSPDLDLEEYFNILEKENTELYTNNAILKLILSKI